MKTLCFLLLGTPVFTAQGQIQFWQDLNIQKNLNTSWQVTADGGSRFQHRAGLNTLFARSGLGYRLSKKTIIQAGGAWLYYSLPSSQKFHELRPWQGIRTDVSLIKRVTLSNYFRLEQRLSFL